MKWVLKGVLRSNQEVQSDLRLDYTILSGGAPSAYLPLFLTKSLFLVLINVFSKCQPENVLAQHRRNGSTGSRHLSILLPSLRVEVRVLSGYLFKRFKRRLCVEQPYRWCKRQYTSKMLLPCVRLYHNVALSGVVGHNPSAWKHLINRNKNDYETG